MRLHRELIRAPNWSAYLTAGGDPLPGEIVQLLEGVEHRLTLAHELNTGRDGAR